MEEWRGRRCYVGKGQVQIAVETVSLKKKKKKSPHCYLVSSFLSQAFVEGSGNGFEPAAANNSWLLLQRPGSVRCPGKDRKGQAGSQWYMPLRRLWRRRPCRAQTRPACPCTVLAETPGHLRNPLGTLSSGPPTFSPLSIPHHGGGVGTSQMRSPQARRLT